MAYRSSPGLSRPLPLARRRASAPSPCGCTPPIAPLRPVSRAEAPPAAPHRPKTSTFQKNGQRTRIPLRFRNLVRPRDEAATWGGASLPPPLAAELVGGPLSLRLGAWTSPPSCSRGCARPTPTRLARSARPGSPRRARPCRPRRCTRAAARLPRRMTGMARCPSPRRCRPSSRPSSAAGGGVAAGGTRARLRTAPPRRSGGGADAQPLRRCCCLARACLSPWLICHSHVPCHLPQAVTECLTLFPATHGTLSLARC